MTIFTAHTLTGSRVILTGVDAVGVVPGAIRFLGNASAGPIPNAAIIMFVVVLVTPLVLNVVLVSGLDVTFQFVITGLVFLIATLIGSLATMKRTRISSTREGAGGDNEAAGLSQ